MQDYPGYAAKAYYNSGTYASPTWVEVIVAKDITISRDTTDVDASVRGASGFALSARGLTKVAAEINLQYDRAGTAYDFLKAAEIAGTLVDMIFMDEDVTTSGAEGIRIVGKLFGFPQNEPLDGILTNTTTLRPTLNEEDSGSLVVPAAFTVA